MSRRRTERWYTRRLSVLATRYGDALDRKGYATLAARQRPQRTDPLTLRAASWQRSARMRHPSMVRRRMGVRVATGPGRLP